jgi:Rv2525c-like, glycoside hydrolase-like domain
MYSRVQGKLGHPAVWSWTSVPVAITIALGLLPVLPARAAVTQHRIKTVAYLGHSFEVPPGWRVINLTQHRQTCVRFDRHTMYVGTPAANEACPSSVVGTTEAMLVEPAPRGAAAQAAVNPVTRKITITSQRLHIVATFRRHPAQIRQILRRAGLGRALHEDPARAERPSLDAPLPAGATSYHGLGFDTCTAPSAAAMSAWRAHSPYRAVGVYIGGSDEACAQPNLTRSWLANEAAQGWHFIPMYVGPQAAFGELNKSSAGQGTAAANDAAAQAERLGFGPQTPIYYDMESYRGHQSRRVLAFLAAWTTRLHQLGFLSGVYSSSLSGIAALGRQTGSYQAPDVIYDALWNGQANTQDPVLHAGQWGHHHRVHQYAGNVTQKFGGTAINIDQDYLDVKLLPKPSRATIDYPAGSAATEYTGQAFDTCSAPSLRAMAAWHAHSRYRGIGVYIGGINRRCGQPNLTAKWVTSVSAQGWRLLPLYVGLQPSCRNGSAPGVKSGAVAIQHAVASSEGIGAADSAVRKAKALGMRSGSILYDYVAPYSTSGASCPSAVLDFISAWTRELHRLGFLAGVYMSLGSGAQGLSGRYAAASFGRPDALWVASWDRKSTLTGWTGVADRQWANHQRAKQDIGPHNATYGGTTIRIDSDWVNAPVATISHAYKVVAGPGLNTRTGPAKSYRQVRTYPDHATLQVICQAPGSAIFTTHLWDKLADGTYVSDYYLSTPSKTGYSPPLPRCAYPYQATATTGLRVRTGPGWSYRVTGRLSYGALAWVVCQQAGSVDGTTPVWDQLWNSRWAPDYRLATPSKTRYSGPAPHCIPPHG